MAMYENLTPADLMPTESAKLIYSQAAFLVSLLVKPESVKENLTSGTYGLKCIASLENSDQGGYWAKMSQGYCQSQMFLDEQGESLEPYTKTWPDWVIVSDNRVMELVILGGRTKGEGCSSWPTPKASAAGPDYAIANRESSGGESLATAVAKQWPTVTARDWRSGTGAQARPGHAQPLTDVVGGQLNADWVECLMAFPLGWTDVDCENPVPWPGWPAPLGVNGKDDIWPTPQGSPGTSDLNWEASDICNRPNKLGWATRVNENGQYSYEPPRVITGQKNRAKRLKCVGNAVSPLQPVPILLAIANSEVMK